MIEIPRAELDRLGQSPILFDALIAEDERSCVFRKVLTLDDPGVREQRTTPRWPHHLPGEMYIALTGQAAVILMRRRGVIDERWRGHGVRIRDARFSAAVLLGETFFVRVELLRQRRLRDTIHTQFAFRMWKNDASVEVEVYRSEQDAMFFPG
jgi:hypothetical protein